MANKKLEELSKTFTYGGGQSTAPISNEQQIKEIPTLSQSEKQNPLAKLAETFSYDTKVEIPKTQPKAAPSIAQPSFDYEAIIKEYESLPNTNIFSRLFNKESEAAYNRKQELNPQYEQAKDIQTVKKLNSLGALDDVKKLWDTYEGHDEVYTPLYDLLKSKGVTDKKELNDLVNNIEAMQKREGIERANKYLTEYADEHPVLGSAFTVPTKMVTGLGSVAETGMNYVAGKPMSNASSVSLSGNKTANEMRNVVSNDMNGVGKFLYGSGMSMADMLANRWILGGLGNVGMGAEKYADTVNEAIDQGLNPTQIVGKGLASGATTYITNKMLTTKSLDAAKESILGLLKEGGLKALGKGGIVKVLLPILAKTGVAEGTQEGLENIADTIADAFIAGGKNELTQSYNQYKANGLSDSEALKKVAGDKALELLQDTAGGFLSGFLMGGAEMGKSGIEYKLNNRNNRNNRNNLPGLNQPKNNAEVPTIQNTQQTEQTTAPTENEVSVSPTFADDVAKIRKTLGDDVTATRDWSNQYAIDFKDSLETLKKTPTVQNYDNAVKALDAYEANLPEGVNVDTNLRDALNNLSAEFDVKQNTPVEQPTSVDLPVLEAQQTNAPTEIQASAQEPTAIQETLRPIATPKEIKSNSSFGESIDGIKKSFSGKANYIGDSKNEYALKFKSTLDAFKNSPTPKNYKNAIKALDEYEANSGSKMMKNWQGEWYEKKFDGSTIRKTLEQFGEQYGLNQEIPKLKKQNNVMAEDIGLNEKPTFKQIPSLDETAPNEDSNTLEVDVSELEDRRNGATYKADTATNTLRNSEVFNQTKKTRQMIENMIEDGTADVDRQTWLAANTEAINNLDEKGFDGVKEDIMKSGTETTQTQIAESVFIVDNEIQKALESGDTTEIQRFTRRLVERMHKVGQALQALRMYGNTAAGMVTATDTIIGDNIKAYMKDADKNKGGKKAQNLKQNAKLANALKQLGYDGSMDVDKAPKTYQQILTEVKNTIGREMGSVENRFSDTDVEYLARLIEHGATTEELKSALNQHLVTGYFGMSAEDLQKINDLYKQADKAGSSKEKAELRKQAAAIAAKYLGKPTFMDRWNSWRYLSMLGNPRTMIRNILGNTTFGAVTDVKDAVGAVLEKALLKEGQRTKAILNPVADKALIDACAKDFDVNAYEEATEGGHKYNMKSDVEDSRQIFKSKLLEGARNLTNNVLEKSDIFALKQKYKKALAGYLKANGYNADVLKTDNAVLDKARAYAIEQAKEATFHADNAIADWLSESSRRAREQGGLTGKVREVLIESIMPFKKTPANILQQGFEYSPLGMFKLISEIGSQEGANAYINTISKALTGSAILALGAWLTSRGLLVGQRKDDDDPFNKGANYALKIGDKTYTIDWTAPAALPLFVGSELYNTFNQNESAEEAKGFFEALAAIAEPAVEMSMLQGLSNTLDSLANTKGNKLGTTVSNIGSGYASQVVPTLLGQVARTIDPYRRSTRTNASSYNYPITATLEKAEKKIANKIPGLSMTNEKYLDVWGEPQKNSGGNLLGRAFQNFISPGYLNDTSLSAREQKLAQLEKTYEGKGSLIPSLADNNKPSGGRMTNEEYSKWAKTRGDELKKAVDAALWHKGRIKESDLQDYIHDIELLANAIAKNKQFGTEIPKTYKKKYEAYKQGGYSAVMKYLIESSK